MNREEARDKYRQEHRLCPVCLSTDLWRTLAGFFTEVKEDGTIVITDKNDCHCKCGWTGIVDDLVKYEEDI